MSALIDFEEYFDPLYGSSVIIPPNCVMYRGYDTRYPIVSDYPSHYSSINVAQSYGIGENKTLGAFTNVKPLRIIDFRYLKLLLSNMFENRPDNNETTLDPIIRTSIGYGMCHIVDQLKLGNRMFINSLGIVALQEYYNKYILNKSYTEKPLDINPISTSGFRIAETNNDAYILQFLKQCMGHMIDGFISPRLKSPYHIEKQYTMSPELIIFDPIQAGIIEFDINKAASLNHITMNSILNFQSSKIEIAYKNIKTTHRTRRGGINNNDLITSDEAFQNAFVHKQQDIVDLLKSAQKAGTKWKKQFTFIDYYAKHPECDLHPWV